MQSEKQPVITGRKHHAITGEQVDRIHQFLELDHEKPIEFSCAVNHWEWHVYEGDLTNAAIMNSNWRNTPGPKLAPFSAETFPLGTVWVSLTPLGNSVKQLVTEVWPSGVQIHIAGEPRCIGYEDLMSRYVMNVDGALDDNGVYKWEPIGRVAL